MVNEQDSLSQALFKCAEAAEALSAQSLSWLPLKSHALYIKSTERVSSERFIDALRLEIPAQQKSMSILATCHEHNRSDKNIP
jgi:hypothetical protein